MKARGASMSNADANSALFTQQSFFSTKISHNPATYQSGELDREGP